MKTVPVGPKRTPALSVLMPVHNGARFLREAVDSILAQTMSDFEFIVIDDGSIDETPAILASYRDTRIRVIRQDNQGLASALNSGLELARTDLVARMDADDVSAPPRLERQYQTMTQHVDISVLGTGFEYLTERGNKSSKYHDGLLHRSTIQRGRVTLPTIAHGSVLLRRHLVLGLGGYRSQWPTGQDFDLWLRVAEHWTVAQLDEPLYLYRIHPSSVKGRAEHDGGWCRALAREYSTQRLRVGSDPLQRGQTPVKVPRLSRSGSMWQHVTRRALCARIDGGPIRALLLATLGVLIRPGNRGSWSVVRQCVTRELKSAHRRSSWESGHG